jgi:serine-type D-Ala-D-Ala carboxypeptidase (penicillin-binding protein 5/6)
MRSRRHVAVCLASLVWLALATATGFAQSPAFETAAREAILVDARSGSVFFEKNADAFIEPASTSKLMTMVMVFEALKAGKLKMDQEFLITEDAWRRGGASSGGSTMYAELNSRVMLGDLIQGVIVQSANDACIAIAEGMAGSEEAFAEQMTRRARELGLTQSVFKNSTGLPDPEHKMTVRELAMLAQYIIANFPEHYHYYSQPSFTWNNITQQNRNPLLTDYPGADGMKTGYIREAGYSLVGSAVRGGRRLVMVIAGLQSITERRKEAQKLLDYGFRQFKSITAYAANEKVASARVWGGERNSVDLVTREDIRILISPAEQEQVEADLHYGGPLMAPVAKGKKVGAVRFMVNGKPISEFPVETGQDVPATDSMWKKALDSLMIMVFGG